MTFNSRRLSAVLPLVFLVSTFLLLEGCASGSGSSLNMSSSTSSGVTKLRTYKETTLANGLKVLFLPDATLPALSMGLLIKSGASSDPAGRAGLSNLVSDLLDQGTKRRTANQIADDLGRMGASFGASVDYDYTYLSLNGLSVSAPMLLSNFAEIATGPSFPNAEIARMKRQTQASIERGLDNPRNVVELGTLTAVFGQHPYGRSVSGSVKSVGVLSKKDVIQHYLRFYRPNNSILVVVGKFDAEFEKKVETTFGSWAKREIPVSALATPKMSEGIRVRVVEKAGLTQAQIRIASVGIKRQDDDFLALRVANTILGGAFASRLNDKIRKELGLTYSISSSFDSRMERGPFVIGTFTKIESIEKVVSESLKIYENFVDKGVTSEELNRARGYLKGLFPQAIETSEKLAFNLVLLRLYGVSDRYLTHYLRELDDLSVSDINAAIRRNMNPKNLVIVVHAPKEATEKLKTVGAQYEVVPVNSL